MDLVRAEIKAWERDFASTHGRDPSVQDIRDQPAIAEKYRLYKRLSKATASQTPPRPHSRRPAESVPPLPGFNPFSPAKKSANHARTSRPPPTSRGANPFATPAKNKPTPGPRRATPSPDTLLPRPPDASSHGHPISTSAVSRARKRLRGEPVSPSPNKPKRQRIRSQAPPSTPKSEQDSSNSEHETDQELPHHALISSFVADSPLKAPAGGKSFKLLFDDALPALSIPQKPVALPSAQLDFGSETHFSQTLADHSVPTSVKPRQISHTQGKVSVQVFPSRDSLTASSHKPTIKSVVSQLTASTKRALDGTSHSQYPLVPPSPPPQDSISSRDTSKAKARVTASRKRLRVEDAESDEGVSSPDDIAPKVATVSLNRSRRRHADDLEWDPLLHLETRNHGSAATEQIDANHHMSGTFTVDLPDKFRHMLAISPSRCQNNTQERVVRGLLYGDRVGHYDPSRGGDIWDAGETDEGALGDAENEDDWEGEPVPWEAGEL